MTVIGDRLNAAWAGASADFVVTDVERERIVASNAVEIARNPNDSMRAAHDILQQAEGRLSAASSGLQAPRGRSVRVRASATGQIQDAQLRLLTAARDQARALAARVDGLATAAQTTLRETMGEIRALGSQFYVDAEAEQAILAKLDGTPEYMRPALAEAIRRDGELYGALSWGIDGENNDKFDAFMDRYAPE